MKGGRQDKETQIRRWLRDLLARGPMARDDILKAAEGTAFAPNSIRRLLPGVAVSSRSGFQGSVTWRLPTRKEALAQAAAKGAATVRDGGEDA